MHTPADRSRQRPQRFFFHFVNWRTGERIWKCELSSIDTGLLLAGVLKGRGHFADPEINVLAKEIYERMD